MNGHVYLRSGQQAIDFRNAPSATKQSFRDGATVDSILKKYATFGVSPNDVGLFQQQTAQMHFGVADMQRDYQSQLNGVLKIKAYFAALPSRLRDFFKHDPQNMLDFMANPKNREKCEEFGLFEKSKPDAVPAPVPVTPTTPPK